MIFLRIDEGAEKCCLRDLRLEEEESTVTLESVIESLRMQSIGTVDRDEPFPDLLSHAGKGDTLTGIQPGHDVLMRCVGAVRVVGESVERA